MTLRLREPDMFIIMKTVQEIAAFLRWKHRVPDQCVTGRRKWV